jgi:hypothetical protein
LTFKTLFLNNYILAQWYQHKGNNFGDDLNPWMLCKMTGKRVINRDEIFNRLKSNIESSNFWKKTSKTIEKAFSLKSYFTFFRI